MMLALNTNNRNKLPPRVHPIPLLALLLLGATFGLLTGCSDDRGSPLEPWLEVTIEGAHIPRVVIQGEPASLSVWGKIPDAGRKVESVGVLVLEEPSENPGFVLVSIVTVPSGDASGSRSSFMLTVELPDLVPGDYVVKFSGSHRREELHVFPREGWIWYLAHGDRMFPTEGLRILKDGKALAFREGESGPGRLELDEWALREVEQWFDEAGFGDLDDFYLDDDPGGRLFVVALRGDEVQKRVVADDVLAPEPLLRLVEQLSGLVDQVMADRPEPPFVIGHIIVDPPLGETGSERLLRLTLVNRSPKTVTLTFGSTQLYDFLLLLPRRDPGDYGGRGLMDADTPDVLIWNWAYDKTFTQVITPLTFAPGEVKTFEETWDGSSNEGEVVGSGIYHVKAEIPADIHVPVRPAGLLIRGGLPDHGCLRAALEIDPVAAPPGSERELTLSVTNVSDETVAVTFLSTQQYDFAVDDPRRCRPGFLWLWSYGRGFGDVVFTEEWAPGEMKIFTDVWDGTTNDGVVLDSGRYMLHGWLAVEGQLPLVRAQPVPFVVERP